MSRRARSSLHFATEGNLSVAAAIGVDIANASTQTYVPLPSASARLAGFRSRRQPTPTARPPPTPATVRGYTTALFAAGTGYYINLDLHHNLNFIMPGLDFYAFDDRGSTSPAVVTLNSVGAGLVYDFQEPLIGEVSLGVPLDHPILGQSALEVYFRLTAKFSSNAPAALN